MQRVGFSHRPLERLAGRARLLPSHRFPVIYIYFDKLQTRIFRRRRTQAPAAAPPQPAE
jgi:hypothetical protein